MNGRPNAVASNVRPPKTRASALSRRSWGAMAAAVLEAAEVMIPAPIAETMRAIITTS